LVRRNSRSPWCASSTSTPARRGSTARHGSVGRAASIMRTSEVTPLLIASCNHRSSRERPIATENRGSSSWYESTGGASSPMRCRQSWCSRLVASRRVVQSVSESPAHVIDGPLSPPNSASARPVSMSITKTR